MTTSTLESRDQFILLRNRLEKLGYKDTFGVDSMPLILRLLNDLVQTTESCKRLKTDNDRFTRDRKRLETEVEPLKQTISQLTKENNMLHVHMINAADSRDEREKKASVAIRKFQNELSDLKFINKQLLTRIESDSRKHEAEKLRMGQILETLGISVGQELDSKHLKLNNPSKLINFVPRIDIETGVEPLKFEERYQPPLYSVDLIKVTEEKCNQMQGKLEETTARLEKLEEQASIHQDQIRVRDDEISRLSSLLENEKGNYEPDDPGVITQYIKGNRVDQLETQLDYLNETISQLEKKNEKLEKEKAGLHAESQEKLTVLTAELKAMYEKNESLCRDLKQLELLVSELQGIKKPPIKKSSVPPLKPSRVDEIYDKLRKANKELEEKKNQIVRMQMQLKTAKDAQHKLSSELKETKQELLDATKKLLEQSKVTDDDRKEKKDHQLKETNQNIELEKKLNEQEEELEYLRDKVEMQRQYNQDLQQEFDESVDQLEQKKNECKELQKRLETLENKLYSNDFTSDHLSQTHLTTSKPDLREQDLPHEENEEPETSVKLKEDKIKSEDVEILIREFDAERDRLINEIDAKTEQVAKLETELLVFKRLSANKNEAMDQLDLLNQELSSCHAEMEQLQRRLEETLQENQRLRHEVEESNERREFVQSDLAASIEENRQLATTLNDSMGKCRELEEICNEQRQQLEYLSEVAESKDSERDQIMTSYRRLVQEHSDNQQSLQRAQQQLQKLQIHSESDHERLNQLTSELDKKNSIIEKLKEDLLETHHEMSEMKQTVELLQFTCQAKDDSVGKLSQELTIIREMVAKSERRAEEAEKELKRLAEDLCAKESQLKQTITENLEMENEINKQRLVQERLEKAVNEERERLIQVELSKRELLMAKNHAELQLAEATNLQQTTLNSSAFAADLKRFQKENSALKEEIRGLKKVLIDQCEQLRQADEERLRMHKSNHYRASSKHYQHHAESPIVHESPTTTIKSDTFHQHVVSSPSLLEEKIARELKSTKNQLKIYEDLINKKLSRNRSESPVRDQVKNETTIIHHGGEDDERCRLLEEENKKLLSVVQQVRKDLKLAQSPTNSEE